MITVYMPTFVVVGHLSFLCVNKQSDNQPLKVDLYKDVLELMFYIIRSIGHETSVAHD